jgi:WD40 repeat protein
MATIVRGEALVHRLGHRFVLDAEPTALLWLGTTAAVTLGDGSVRWIDDGAHAPGVPVHTGAILSACRHPDGAAVVTGGDDGRVCRISRDGAVAELGRFERKWIGHLVASPALRLIVAGVGKEAIVWTAGGTTPSHRYAVGAMIGGLAFDGKGKRLGIAHYNGATLVYGTNPDSGRVALNWIGSHLACTISADGRYLLTALQETGLHGWQLPGLRDMRMSGYAAKTRSFSWDRRGRWLATSGDARAILWPFEGKTGPMGKAPWMLAERKGALVTQVAFHPKEDLLAVGYSDGVVALARLADDDTLLLDEGQDDDGGGYITVLAWNDAGTRLGWGDKAGWIGILDMGARA